MSLLSRLAVQAARAYGILSARSTNISADFLVVAGGGPGGYSGNAYYKSGGGGAGGFRTSAGTSGGGASAESAITLSTLNTYTITVGAGGATNSSTNPSNGSNSSISGTGLTTITSIGGGYGGPGPVANNGNSGGSGGGGQSSSYASDTSWAGGAGTTSQGYAGGTGYFTSNTTISLNSGAGGGGAGAVGSNGVSGTTGAGGNGGTGVASSISGSSVTYAGGGGGGGYSTGGTGGSGGGGNGGGGTVGTAGTANTGGGGGGSAGTTTAITNTGGSGIVIISYTSATPKFVGGTLTTSGGKQIHTFTSSGTLSPITPITASYLVVAGGGGSARQLGGYAGNGGGGAGGLLSGSTTIYSGATYVVTVGAGGAGGTTSGVAPSGSNSVLSGTGLTTLTSTGGGGGGGSTGPGANGGSGGGGSGEGTRAGGTGTSGQGNNGGNGVNAGGGGGGSGAAGANAVTTTGGAGGIGTQSSISGTATYYAGGGGGGAYSSGTAGTGGSGGGGNGGAGTSNTGNTPGTANTGGGAGGTAGDPATAVNGQSGGSGIVIISYAGSQVFNGGLVTTSGGNTIHTFTSTGALTPLTNNLNNSLRFRASASAYLSRTPASASNRKTWTWSGWVKKAPIQGSASTLATLMGCTTGSTDSTYLRFGFYQDKFIVGNNSAFFLQSTPLYRDPSAWYHVVVSTDTNQGSASNRMRVYINGNEVTAWSTDQRSTYLTSSVDLAFNQASQHSIGSSLPNAGDYLDGYLTDVYFVDGQQLEPYYFGNNDANGVWKPIQYKGTYGTNGFYLPFTNTTASGFSSYYGSFNGSTQKLTVPASSNFAPSTGDFTVEGWFKTSSIPAYGATVFSQAVSGTNYFLVGIGTGDVSPKNYVNFYATSSGGGTPIYSSTTFEFNTWNHFAVVRQNGIVTVYLNGIGGTPTPNTTDLNNTTYVPTIGQYTHSSANAFSGELSNFRYVKGTAVYTGNFTPPTTALTAISGTQLLTLQNSTIIDNSTNALTITNTGSVATTSATVGTYTSFIGDDNSSNNNNWIPNNINYTSSGTTYDAMTDVPTNTSATVANYCTLNPLIVPKVASPAVAVINEGNLAVYNSGASNWLAVGSTIGVTSGKWYWEVTPVGTLNGVAIGIHKSDTYFGSAIVGYSGDPDGYAYLENGNKVNNSTGTAYGATYASGNVIGVALDMDAGTLTYYKNNTSQGTAFTGLSGSFMPASSVAQSCTLYHNFGQRPFSYTPPTGFVALNTFNLPTPTILQGNRYMDATLYTGNGSSQTIVNQGQFRPDFVWIKRRDGAGQDHVLQDSNRGFGGTTKLASSSTAAENTTGGATGSEWGFVTAANSNGFNITASTNGDQVNRNTWTYVGWQWQAGQGSTSSNTAGSITSTVSVNTTAGFSIVRFTGTGANATIGHGLGVAPRMFIVKTRSGVADWVVYHASVGNTAGLYLNQTLAATTSSAFFNNTTPTSSVFTLGNGVVGNGVTAVAYCWAEIEGFSKFGSYTGNSSSDGPFIYTGFRPEFVMVKRSSSTGPWEILDSSRNTFNVTQDGLRANASDAEINGIGPFDFLSNGFKLRGLGGVTNDAGTFIYAAFAEHPFKNSNAR